MNIEEELTKLISDDQLDFWHYALSKVIDKAELTNDEIDEIVTLLKSDKGIIDKDKSIDFSRVELDDLLKNTSAKPDISLSKISDIKNVNALSSNTELEFQNDGLTVIYGDNGTGKSGYAKILRRVCRFRGKKPNILPNLFENSEISGETGATLIFSIDNQDKETYEWVLNETQNDKLKNISVFDRNSAVQYIEEKNEVAFRPSLLQILDDFASTLDRVRGDLQEDINSISKKDYYEYFENHDNSISKFIKNLSKDSSIKRLNELSEFTDEDKEKIEEIEKDRAIIKAKDPKDQIKEINAQLKRIEKLKKDLIRFKYNLRRSKIDDIRELVDEKNSAVEAAELASKKQFDKEPLDGVGSDVWLKLWRAAEKYSNSFAYPQKEFPFTEDGARCVFCQQELEQDGLSRIKRFHEFVEDTARENADELIKEVKEIRAEVERFGFGKERVEDLIEELVANGFQNLALKIREHLKNLNRKKNELLEKIDQNGNQWNDLKSYTSFPLKEINQVINGLEEQKDKLNSLDTQDDLDAIENELRYLKDKKKLKELREEIEDEIKKRVLIEQLEDCKKETSTNIVTLVSNKLTPELVTKELCTRFKKELQGLGFSYFEILLDEDSGKKGVTYHKIKFKENEDIDVGNVLSEGEYRCIALAHFLSELATTENKSGIVFDDPVTSLDHKWSNNIASRLVEEVQNRQVIVFTHDITFLIRLSEYADRKKTDIDVKSIVRNLEETGIAEEAPPWYSQNVNQRVGVLKKKQQKLEKILREKSREEYENKASKIYGKLRETWERLVEELLLNSVVVRFGRTVETRRLKRVVDIDQKDYDKIEKAMSKCSGYLTGHDQASALNEPLPEPDEILDDINELDEYRKELQDDRKRYSR